MKINAQARNYALKHGIHIYGLTNEQSRALVFYDIASGTKLCTYKSYSDDNPLQKSLNYKMKPETWQAMPDDIRTAQGVQKAIEAMVVTGTARPLDEDKLAEARNKILSRSTGVKIL